MSVWELVSRADPIVKGVLLVLVVFSLISWAIIVQRFLLLKKAWAQSVAFLDRFHATVSARSSLDPVRAEVSTQFQDSPVASAFVAGYDEWGELVRDPQGDAAVMDNVHRALRKASSEALTRLERSIPFLASCGSAAPFIGLFGTVWGILRAFQQIGATGTTSIAEVGPFISEALIATALGLFAAIPAVMFYNYFVNRLKLLASELNHFSLDFLNLVERSERSRRAG
ncbi:MAG: MotA/TolQ/ExbB proton channel family protein [Deltaproteobacteria bacterium]|nr:MotA/TolQ/ExbB proton channel family protein [Deltaproteobacteria bacterium]